MPRLVLLRAATTAFLLTATSWPAAATELHVGLASPPHAGTPREAAEAFLRVEARRLGLEGVDLVHRQALAFAGYRTVRFAQAHEGLPVLGAAAAVRVAGDGRVTAVALQVARQLRVGPTPRVAPAEVRELLAAQIGPALAAARLVLTLAVLPEPAGPGRLVWQVDAAYGRGGTRYLVDAQRAEVLQSRPLARHALGRVFAISRVNTPGLEDLELPDLVPADPQLLTGWAGQLVVTNYVSGGVMSDYVVAQTLSPTVGADFLYDPPASATDATDGFAQVMLYYHLTRGRAFFAGTLGVDFTPASWKVLAVANTLEEGEPLDNAFFSELPMGAPWNTANIIAVGQGTEFDFADDSDVFLHEFTHYVSYNAIDFNMTAYGVNEYGRSPFSGALDEGLSDYFASTVNGNPVLGETSLAPFGQARDLTVTTKVCPTDMNGEVHDDGEIIGSLSWTLREAFGRAVGDQLVWGAMSLLMPYATFGDYAQALLTSANELVIASQLTAADVQTITDALTARGLLECFAALPLRVGEPRKMHVQGFDSIGALTGRTCAEMRERGRIRQSLFHFAVTPAATDQGVKLLAQLTADAGADLKWKIYARQGQHVEFATEGMSITVGAYDWVTDDFTGNAGELQLDATTTPAFDPAQSYHFVVVHQNCPDAVLRVAVETVVPPQEDAGVDAAPALDAAGDDAGGQAAGGGGGCGCRAAGAGGVPVLGLLAALALAWRRRGRLG